jgi:predicted ArsR family transcriptional regulator
MELEKHIYDGNRAKEILENEVFQRVMADIKQEIIEQWQTSPARDQEGREKLWNLLKLAEKLEIMLKQTFDSGKLALAELEHQQSLAERAKDYLRDLIG